jgi:hypothetical protein
MFLPPFPYPDRAQVLPLNDLAWEHFERLCLRYVRSRSSVVMTQLYGVAISAVRGADRISVRCTSDENLSPYGETGV